MDTLVPNTAEAMTSLQEHVSLAHPSHQNVAAIDMSSQALYMNSKIVSASRLCYRVYLTTREKKPRYIQTGHQSRVSCPRIEENKPTVRAKNWTGTCAYTTSRGKHPKIIKPSTENENCHGQRVQ